MLLLLLLPGRSIQGDVRRPLHGRHWWMAGGLTISNPPPIVSTEALERLIRRACCKSSSATLAPETNDVSGAFSFSAGVLFASCASLIESVRAILLYGYFLLGEGLNFVSRFY